MHETLHEGESVDDRGLLRTVSFRVDPAHAWHSALWVESHLEGSNDAAGGAVACFRVEDGRPVRLTEDRPIALTELAEELRAYKERVFLVGDGAELSFRTLSALGLPCDLAPENLRDSHASVATLARNDGSGGLSTH